MTPEQKARQRANDRRYRERHPERQAAKCRRYAAANRERINENARRRYHTRPEVRLSKIIRASIGMALRRRGGKRAKQTAELLGYPVEVLVEWAARNGYNPPVNNIDHRIPLAWWLDNFPPDVALRKAWQLWNLQVIPARDNFRKGGRRRQLL